MALSSRRSPAAHGVQARATALVTGVLLAVLSIALLVWALLARGAQLSWLPAISNVLAASLAGLAPAVSLLAWYIRSGRKTVPDAARPQLMSLAEAKPSTLEVKRSLRVETAHPRLPDLTPYVRRDHDVKLEELARGAARGESQVVVVYGESSTGKTRSCWEMLAPLRDASPEWRLWRPVSPTPAGTLLAGLPLVEPRTVIWLNEANTYLNTPDGAGDRAAAALRELTDDPSRGPVLVVATLWPDDWRVLTEDPRRPTDDGDEPQPGNDPHIQARALLAGHGHLVPVQFTPADPGEMARQSEADPRWAEAVTRAPGGKIIQYLAGVPLLMDRYDSARPPEKALIHAAMDARRMGYGRELPPELLVNAAPGYMPDDPVLYGGENWASKALKEASQPLVSGIEGMLTKVPPDAQHRRGQKPGHERPPASGERYRLAEYLDQHGRRERHDIVPPPTFWDAALNAVAPDQLQLALAYSARNRGLLRTAALLSKQIAPQGAWAAGELIEIMDRVCPDDPRPAQWAAEHAPVSQTDGIANLINAINERAGARFLAPLLARGVVAHASLDDPVTVANLIYALEQAGALKQAEDLTARAVRAVPLGRGPHAVADLLEHLCKQGKTLRPALHTDVLAARAARDAPLDDPWGVAALLDALHEMNDEDLKRILLARDPVRHAVLTTPESAGALLRALRRAHARDHADALAARVARESPLSQPGVTAGMLGILLESGDRINAQALLSRDPASHADVADPGAVARLLGAMKQAGAREQVGILAERASHGTILGDPAGAADLLTALRQAGEPGNASAVAGRASREASLREPKGLIALLDAVREAGTEDDRSLLLRRAHESCRRRPSNIPWLVDWLWRNGSTGQALDLATRGAADVSADELLTVANMLQVFRRIKAPEQSAALLARNPASRVVLGTARTFDAAYLLSELLNAGATEQRRILVGRLPACGQFDLFLSQDQNRGQYRFGMEHDGRPSPPWDWDSLCQ